VRQDFNGRRDERVRIARVCLAVFGIAFLGGGSHSASAAKATSFVAAQPAAASNGLVSGTVLDAVSGSPVSGAVVRIHRTEERTDITGATLLAFSNAPLAGASSVTTGKDGHFEFGGLPRGTFYVWVQHRMYLPGGFGQRRYDGPRLNLELRTDEKRADVRIYLWKPARVAGRVHDENGDPVVGAGVLALRRVFVGGRERFAQGDVAETDDRGHYRFTAVSPGDYVVAIPSGTFSIPTEIVDVYAQPENERSVRLREELSRSGAPLPTDRGVAVGHQVIDWRGPAGRIVPTTSSDRPALHVYPLVFYPSASSPGDAARLHVEAGIDLTAIDFDMQLMRSLSVSGRVAPPAGQRIRTALRLVPSNLDAVTSDRGLETAVTIADEDGNFRFVGIPPGDYVIKTIIATGAWDPMPGSVASLIAATQIAPNVWRARDRPTDEALLWADLPITVGDSDVTGLDVRLHVGARLQGRLIFEGAAELPTKRQLTNVPVHLEPVDRAREGALAAVRPDDSGAFITASYPPGRYRVFVGVPNAKWRVKSVVADGVDVHRSLLNLGSHDVTDVVVTFTDVEYRASGSVQGDRFEDVPHATVIAFPADFETWISLGMNPHAARSTNCNSLGTYSFRNMRPGDNLLVAFSAADRVDIEDPNFIREAARRAIRYPVVPGDNRVPILRLPPRATASVTGDQEHPVNPK
jgi:protocatechuate 3,4-dioxygenase beta subunit